MDLVDRDLGMELENGFLDRCEADPAGRVRRDEDEAVADGQGAVPDLGITEIVGRQAALKGRLGQREQTGLADQVGLGRPHGRHV